MNQWVDMKPKRSDTYTKIHNESVGGHETTATK